MAKWKYATLSLDSATNQLVFTQPKGGPEPVGTATDVVSALNRLGEEGWELASALAEKDDNWTMYLKMPGN